MKDSCHVVRAWPGAVTSVLVTPRCMTQLSHVGCCGTTNSHVPSVVNRVVTYQLTRHLGRIGQLLPFFFFLLFLFLSSFSSIHLMAAPLAILSALSKSEPFGVRNPLDGILIVLGTYVVFTVSFYYI
jgi:hypothetical protein